MAFEVVRKVCVVDYTDLYKRLMCEIESRGIPMLPHIDNDLYAYRREINGISFMVEIFPGVAPVNTPYDVVVVVVPFEDSFKLNEHVRPSLFFQFPVLLVRYSDKMAQEKLQRSFMFEFGPYLAYFLGASKYIEYFEGCNQSLVDVFDEAIRISRKCGAYSYGGVVIKDLMYLLIQKALKDRSIDEADISASPWYELFHYFMYCNYGKMVNHHLTLVDQDIYHVASASKEDFSLENCAAYRRLEVESINFEVTDIDFYHIRSVHTMPQCTLWCAKQLFCFVSNNIEDLSKEITLLKAAVSLKFTKQACGSIIEWIDSNGLMISVKTLVIISCTGTLVLDILNKLQGLEKLVIIDTQVDLSPQRFPKQVSSDLKCLVLKHCFSDQLAVSQIVETFTDVKVLDISSNNFKTLPMAFGLLKSLETLRCDRDQIVFPPGYILRKAPQEIVEFLNAYQVGPTENQAAKIMVVGQEGVGKSTLVKSANRSFPITKTKAPQKTDGVDISVLHLNKTSKCTVYDMAGDVEYLNTHSLFFSKNCLHLVVFDLSQLPIGKEIRSSDQFCRLELWFQTIACQDPNACIVVVGTHVDHPRLSPEVLTSIKSNFDQVLLRYSASHATSSERVDGCLLCETSTNDNDDATQRADDSVYGTVPHILGYFEVSGVTNKNVKRLKAKLQDLISDIKQRTGTKEIPCKWVDFKQAAQDKLSSDEELTNQPILSLSSLHDLAFKVEIFYESDIVAMLRFFHSQGDVLWYEDIPEMKDVVILDPQWLSNQLCSLISYNSDVNSICEGILRHRDLPKAWCHITEENRCKLISLFRSMGLCFSISKTEDLFPCKLQVGWPDREMWPPIPNPNENQTSVVYTFSFLPPSFFPDLIVAIHKKKDSFPSGVQPLYYRFNVVYMTKDEGVCHLHQEVHSSHESRTSCKTEQSSAPHRIHLEAMSHNNTVKVTIRGPRPCCMLPDIRSTIEMVQSGRFPGVVYKEMLICPECEVKRVRNPATMNLQGPCDGVCSNGHIYVDKQHVLMGKMAKDALVSVEQPRRLIGETLQDHACPKLFVVLPINLDSLSLLDRFVYSYIRDGYAVHLICECPGQWHFTPSPGFRVGKPKEFFEKYGGRVCKMLRFISALGTPFKLASALDPHCKAGVSAANAAEKIRSEISAILENYLEKYPHLKASLGSANDDLKDLKSARGLQRSELARFLDVAAKERDFGPLVCTYVDMCNEWLWLCEEHNQQYEVIER